MDYITQRARVPVTSSAPRLPHWIGTGLTKRDKLISTLPGCQMAQHPHRICRSLTPSTFLDLLLRLLMTRYLFRPSYWKTGQASLTSSDRTGVPPSPKDCSHQLPVSISPRHSTSSNWSLTFFLLEVVKYLCMYSRCAQVCVRTLNGKQGCSVSVSKGTSILALDLLLGDLNGISMIGIVGDAHIAFSTSTHKYNDSSTANCVQSSNIHATLPYLPACDSSNIRRHASLRIMAASDSHEMLLFVACSSGLHHELFVRSLVRALGPLRSRLSLFFKELLSALVGLLHLPIEG